MVGTLKVSEHSSGQHKPDQRIRTRSQEGALYSPENAEPDPWRFLGAASLPPDYLAALSVHFPAGPLPLHRHLAAETKLFRGESLLLFAPTGAGKSLAAELAAWRHLREGRRAVFAVPTRALARELAATLEERARPLGRRVLLATGDHQESDPLALAGRYDIMVAIYEKIRTYEIRQPRWLDGVGLFVADEIQTVADPGRGPEIELLLTAIRQKWPALQLLAMTAVAGNPKPLAQWLQIDDFTERSRPIPLREGVFDAQTGIYHYREWSDMPREGQELLLGEEEEPGQQDERCGLAVDAEDGWELLQQGGASISERATVELAARLIGERDERVLVFVTSRRQAERWAALIGKRLMQDRGEEESAEPAADRFDETASGESLIEERLEACLKKGSGFHHAGLPESLRIRVEEAYRRGDIRALVATPTLSQGVNLTGDFVISVPHMVVTDLPGANGGSFRTTGPQHARTLLDRGRFRNQGGRAARPTSSTAGGDKELGNTAAKGVGRSILIATTEGERQNLQRLLIDGDLPTTQSVLSRLPLEECLLWYFAWREGGKLAEVAAFLEKTLDPKALWQAEAETPESILSIKAAALAEKGLLQPMEDAGWGITAIGALSVANGFSIQTTLGLVRWLDRLGADAPSAVPSPLEAIWVASSSHDARLRPVPLSRYERRRHHYGQELQDRLQAEAGIAWPEVQERLSASTETGSRSGGGYTESDLAAAKKALALEAWLGTQPTRALEERFRLDAGELQAAASEAQWILEGAASLAEALGIGVETHQPLLALAARLPLGLPKGAGALGPLRSTRLGRGAWRQLVREGFDTPRAIAAVPVELLAQLIGQDSAESIRARATLYLKRREEARQLQPHYPHQKSGKTELTLESSKSPAAHDCPGMEIIEAGAGHFRFGGADVRLKPLAARLLLYLAEHRGQVVTYDAIERDVWDYPPQRDQIHQHKAEIVKAATPHLGRSGAEKLVRTIRGRGLRMEVSSGG